MKSKLLSVVCASAIIMAAGMVNAADKKAGELSPQPAGHEMKNHKGEPKFDKKMHQRMADKFAKELGLSDEQKAEAKKIRKEGREKVEPLMKEMKVLREKMDKMREENMKEFEKILTPEQKAKMEQMKKEHDEMREKRKLERKQKKDAMKIRKEHKEHKKD